MPFHDLLHHALVPIATVFDDHHAGLSRLVLRQLERIHPRVPREPLLEFLVCVGNSIRIDRFGEVNEVRRVLGLRMLEYRASIEYKCGVGIEAAPLFIDESESCAEFPEQREAFGIEHRSLVLAPPHRRQGRRQRCRPSSVSATCLRGGSRG